MGNSAPSIASQQLCCCAEKHEKGAPSSLVSQQASLAEGLSLKEMEVHSANEIDEVQEHGSVSLARHGERGKSKSSDPKKQLLKAVRCDDAPAALQLIADGADALDVGEALRLACQRGSSSVVRELVAVGVVVNEACPHTGFTPLQLAAAGGHIVPCELLLDALADVHRPVGGATPLGLARKMGHLEVEEVIERHIASLLLQEQGQEADDAAQFRRAHVLPRVSPVLSEAVLQALPPPPPGVEAGGASAPRGEANDEAPRAAAAAGTEAPARSVPSHEEVSGVADASEREMASEAPLLPGSPSSPSSPDGAAEESAAGAGDQEPRRPSYGRGHQQPVQLVPL